MDPTAVAEVPANHEALSVAQESFHASSQAAKARLNREAFEVQERPVEPDQGPAQVQVQVWV
jgi:hypothetical protein